MFSAVGVSLVFLFALTVMCIFEELMVAKTSLASWPRTFFIDSFLLTSLSLNLF